MRISIVTSLYCSAPYLSEFYQRMKVAVEKITPDYEIIFVNDGSPDNSIKIVLDLQKNDPKVIVIDLSRNFGHHKALMTGLSHADGDLVFLIDSDLEEEPELLNKFYEHFNNNECDVVYGVQVKRKGGWFERISGALYYKLVRWLSDSDMPVNPLIARLMTNSYVNNLLKHQERDISIEGLLYFTGYKQDPVIVKKHSKGKTTYTLRKKMQVFLNTLTSLSNKPLISIFYLGLVICTFSCAYIIDLIVNRILYSDIMSGWTSLIVSIWFLGGLILLSLGTVGFYLSKIAMEVRQRPYTIIKNIYGKKSHE